MTSPAPPPFILRFDRGSGALEPHTSHVVRRASDLRRAFSDVEAWERLVTDDDPVVHEVFQCDVPEEVGQLVNCTAVFNPSAVGSEYFLIKGHYHAVRGRGEVYYGLAGNGHLLLTTARREPEALHLLAGRPAEDRPARISVVDIDAKRLAAIREVHERLEPTVELRYIESSGPSVNDSLAQGVRGGEVRERQ